jgi:ADP-ribose pyrophosphatase YjhB (NUDIX family)
MEYELHQDAGGFVMDMDPTGGAPLPATYFRPRESERSIYTEKKIGDEWVALWETRDLPEDANVTHVTLIPYRGEKAVVSWQKGVMRLPEGEVQEGESLAAAMERIAKEQCGILHAKSRHLGHFKYTAGSRNPKYPVGAITYQVLFGIEVSELADFPSDERFERRIVLQRDLNQILRTSYVEMRREYADALDTWLLERLKAQQAASTK